MAAAATGSLECCACGWRIPLRDQPIPLTGIALDCIGCSWRTRTHYPAPEPPFPPEVFDRLDQALAGDTSRETPEWLRRLAAAIDDLPDGPDDGGPALDPPTAAA